MSDSPALRPGCSLPISGAAIADFLGVDLEGDPAVLISGIRSPEKAGSDEIAFLSHDREAPEGFSPGCVLIGEKDPIRGTAASVIRHPDPRAAFARLIELFLPVPPPPFEGISLECHVHPAARVSAAVAIAPGAFVGPDVVIGERSVIHPGVVLEQKIDIGCDVVIGGNVVIYPGTSIGDGTIVHAGAVIGGDGFGFTEVDGQVKKIPQRGGVVIGDDCEIGCGTTIDRGVLDDTVIGDGCKLDNLVQIGHNCILGKQCLLAGQVGLAGSTILGDGTQMGGQSGVIGHLEVGAGARIATKTGVTSDVAEGQHVLGFPSIDMQVGRRAYALIARLPEMRERIRNLEAQLRDAGISPETREEKASS